MIVAMRRPGNIRAKAWKRLMDNRTILENGCWQWTGARWGGGDKRKYGVTSYAGNPDSAHRVSYRIFKGEIPSGLDVEHLCQNPLCINPEHLQASTRLVNIRRDHPWLNEGKCKYGHSMEGKKSCPTCARKTPRVMVWLGTGKCKHGHERENGTPQCKTCRAQWMRRQRKKRLRSGLCAYFGCKDAPEQGKTRCHKHLEQVAAGWRRWAEKRLAKVRTVAYDATHETSKLLPAR
jgi:hypothetical protein